MASPWPLEAISEVIAMTAKPSPHVTSMTLWCPRQSAMAKVMARVTATAASAMGRFRQKGAVEKADPAAVYGTPGVYPPRSRYASRASSSRRRCPA